MLCDFALNLPSSQASQNVDAALFWYFPAAQCKQLVPVSPMPWYMPVGQLWQTD
jgi:hypothetical protein